MEHCSAQLIFTRAAAFGVSQKCRNTALVTLAGRNVEYMMGLDAPDVGTN